MKNAEHKASLNMFGVSDELQNMASVSAEMTNLWLTFHRCVTKAGTDLVKLQHITTTIKDLHAYLGDDSAKFSKKDFMATLIGKQPVGEITIHAPALCKNKGSGLKKQRIIGDREKQQRIVGEREKAINKSKKKTRKCKLCDSIVHDQRTCPTKKKV